MKLKRMKRSNKLLLIIAGSLVVIGLVIYGSMSLISKLDRVDELSGKLEETADSSNQPSDQTEQTEQTPETEPEQTPEPMPSTQPEEALQPSPAATLTPEPTSDNLDEGHESVDESTIPEEKSRKKKEIDASVTAKLGKLKSSCQASSNSLVRQIAQELNADEEATLATIQDKYLNKVFAAEANCDAKFNQLVSNAKSEYKAADLGDQALPDWSSQYESAKAAARADALAVIANSLNK